MNVSLKLAAFQGEIFNTKPFTLKLRSEPHHFLFWKGTSMTIPAWVKPALTGALLGAIALAILGFNWGGWTTQSTAEKMATDRANVAVVEVLTPFCVARAQQNPDALAEFAAITTASKRQKFVTDAGWATVSGEGSLNRDIAKRCATALAQA
jgi:hypothetical protein